MNISWETLDWLGYVFAGLTLAVISIPLAASMLITGLMFVAWCGGKPKESNENLPPCGLFVIFLGLTIGLGILYTALAGEVNLRNFTLSMLIGGIGLLFWTVVIVIGGIIKKFFG